MSFYDLKYNAKKEKHSLSDVFTRLTGSDNDALIVNFMLKCSCFSSPWYQHTLFMFNQAVYYGFSFSQFMTNNTNGHVAC